MEFYRQIFIDHADNFAVPTALIMQKKTGSWRIVANPNFGVISEWTVTRPDQCRSVGKTSATKPPLTP